MRLTAKLLQAARKQKQPSDVDEMLKFLETEGYDVTAWGSVRSPLIALYVNKRGVPLVEFQDSERTWRVYHYPGVEEAAEEVMDWLVSTGWTPSGQGHPSDDPVDRQEIFIKKASGNNVKETSAQDLITYLGADHYLSGSKSEPDVNKEYDEGACAYTVASFSDVLKYETVFRYVTIMDTEDREAIEDWCIARGFKQETVWSVRNEISYCRALEGI
jgi:hypothetical protein